MTVLGPLAARADALATGLLQFKATSPADFRRVQDLFCEFRGVPFGLVAAQGRCQPEDVGGPPGYAEFLAAIADPAHEDHDHMLTWRGGVFDPNSPDIEHIADQLDRLARQWAPRPRKPRTTSPRS